MEGMFNGAAVFDQDIGGWETSNVINMRGMFASAASIDQNIGGWDTSKVTEMQHMFAGAAAFEQDLSTWCVELIDEEPNGFGNAGVDPSWGGGNCPTLCSIGADGNACQNSNTETGLIPFGSEATDTYSCTCAAGYKGANCEIKTPCDTCSNGMKPANGGAASGFVVDGDCACDCADGYEGANCEEEELQGKTHAAVIHSFQGYIGRTTSTTGAASAPRDAPRQAWRGSGGSGNRGGRG